MTSGAGWVIGDGERVTGVMERDVHARGIGDVGVLKPVEMRDRSAGPES